MGRAASGGRNYEEKAVIKEADAKILEKIGKHDQAKIAEAEAKVLRRLSTNGQKS